jgi:hypothetical protein
MRHSQRLLYVAMSLTLFVGVPAHVQGLRAPVQPQAQDPHHSGQEFAPDAATPAQREGMMNQNTMKMMSEMKAADAKLDSLVQAMNAAEGAKKTDAIAAVVTALVDERRSMHSSMAAMMNMMGMMNQTGAPASAAPAKPKP